MDAGISLLQSSHGRDDPLEARLRAVITRAFPAFPVPQREKLVEPGFEMLNGFEFEEIQRVFGGRPWTALSRSDVETHPDWIVYLDPGVAAYYLPAWLQYSVDWMAADYPSAYIMGLLGNPPPALVAQLTDDQRAAFRALFGFLRLRYPEELRTIPPPQV